ncbi:MAG: glycosyltransferase, partial [Thermoleophilaceae bacterium]|nr:glycosyltransferase [Thermoleophilaceae bacterium]
MTTTIVIPSYDEVELLRASLPAAARQEDAEVLVVDAGSSPATAQLAREHG